MVAKPKPFAAGRGMSKSTLAAKKGKKGVVIGKKKGVLIGKKKPVSAKKMLLDVAIPTAAEIDSVSAALDDSSRVAFQELQALLTQHLGSVEAARLWLATPASEYGKPPLSVVKEGKAALVLAILKNRWGPSPAYA